MKACLVIPYFGQFNNYFEFWLNSCGYNTKFDWLIFTDAIVPDNKPQNVHIIKSSLYDIKRLFERKLKMTICLEEPYKLCDFKQFYGFLFSEYLAEYDYWGYCDCDTIWGDFSAFVTDEVMKSYDKILRTGHLSFVRNTKKINENFLNYSTYRITTNNPVIYGYDESVGGYHLGFAGELLDQGYLFLDKSEWIADVDFRHFPFYTVGNNCFLPSVFVYDNGKIYQVWRTNGVLEKKEMMYLHLQKRKINVIEGTDRNKFIVCPNEIRPYDNLILENASFWESISFERENYFDKRKEKREQVVRDIKRFYYEPHKIDCLRYRLMGQ